MLWHFAFTEYVLACFLKSSKHSESVVEFETECFHLEVLFSGKSFETFDIHWFRVSLFCTLNYYKSKFCEIKIK